MSRTAMNQALAEGFEREFGKRYCRGCSTERSPEGGEKRPGMPWRCGICVDRAKKARAAVRKRGGRP